MRTVAARQTTQPDLTTAPKALDWLRHCRDNEKLTLGERALSAILPTLGQGQNITMSITGMADILGSDRETTGNALKSLIAKGLVAYVRPGKNNKSVYRLTLPRCWPDRQQGVGQTDSKVSVIPTADVGDSDTTSIRDVEVDDDLHQHALRADDDVATSTTGSNRAKGSARPKKVRPVDEYVSDLEGCRPELARRLGVDPDDISVKPLAKQLRNLNIKFSKDDDCEDTFWSEMLDICPEDDPVWAMASEKVNPVGFLRFALEERLDGRDVTAYYQPPAKAESVVEIDPRVLADKIFDVLAKGQVREDDIFLRLGSDYDSIQPALDLLVADGTIVRSIKPEGEFGYYLYVRAEHLRQARS